MFVVDVLFLDRAWIHMFARDAKEGHRMARWVWLGVRWNFVIREIGGAE